MDATLVRGCAVHFDRFVDEIDGCFRRRDLRCRASSYIRGLLGPVQRKNGWQLAEHLGDATPHRRHLLADVITRAVCGVIVGCSGPTSIERWAKAKADWLEALLSLQHGSPSRNCIRRVLSALKPDAFQTCFQSWMMSVVSQDDQARPTIAINGKTMHRSHDRSRGLGPLHLVSAFAASNLSWLRRIAISLLKCHPPKHSIKGKSEIAGWNNEFLMQVLEVQRT